jgi:penicillin amidase
MTEGTTAHAAPRRGLPRWVNGGVAALALAGALHVGFRPTYGAPALGPFLDPANGFWALARSASFPRRHEERLTGVTAPVEVRYDDRGVPHIFASDEFDAARALGWVHARDRLFQMELTQRAVAGTLTELVGARALPLDRTARRQGLAEAAESKWAAMDERSATKRAVTAYMEGVNAYVAQMRRQDLPLEYRLLGRRPRTFEPRDTYYLLARMSLTLAWQDDELQRAALEELIGVEATDALFSVEAPIQEPIEPVAGRRAPRTVATPIPAPRAAGAQQVARAKGWLDLRANFAGDAARGADGESLTRGEAVVGSNNWAVAPKRTAHGNALLAGDPHLQLTLPSIWYEAHIVVPEVMDVYGVTLPLAPIVPIGFNRDVAWTATNTGADVMDFYRETVDDSVAPKRYMLDGAWRDLAVRTAEYRDAADSVLATDTLYRTHRGPMIRSEVGWVSMRWTALEQSDEGDALRRASRTRSARDWYREMESYRAPAQNFLVADRSGTIGIRSTGRYPVRPGDGRGDRVFDGSTAKSDWIGEWPLARYPQSLDPDQGFLASANQQPVDPAAREGYLGWSWPSPWRAMRINEILRADSAMTREQMQRAQVDPRSALTLPIREAVVQAIEGAPFAMNKVGVLVRDLTAEQRSADSLLATWSGEFSPDEAGPVYFDALLSALQRLLWDELVPPGADRRVATPSTANLVRLLADSASPWWDRRSTADLQETRDQVVLAAMQEAWTSVSERWGSDPSRWRWGSVRRMNIHHLLQLPGLGRTGLEVTGGPGTLSPADGGGTHGASWRFVVELGPQVEAWATYPGGQSGNPASARYADRVEQWRRGELSPLNLPRSPADLTPRQLTSRLTLAPEK